MQLAGSDLVKSVLQLIMGTNTTNVWIAKRNIISSYKHEIMAKSFMKAFARNIFLWEMTQFQMVKCNVKHNLNTSYVKKDR